MLSYSLDATVRSHASRLSDSHRPGHGRVSVLLHKQNNSKLIKVKDERDKFKREHTPYIGLLLVFTLNDEYG